MSLFSRWLHRTGPCRCGHTETAHSHYRAGSECAEKGCYCARLRPTRVRGLRRSTRRMVAELNRIHPGYAQPTDTIADRSGTNWARVADLYREEH